MIPFSCLCSVALLGRRYSLTHVAALCLSLGGFGLGWIASTTTSSHFLDAVEEEAAAEFSLRRNFETKAAALRPPFGVLLLVALSTFPTALSFALKERLFADYRVFYRQARIGSGEEVELEGDLALPLGRPARLQDLSDTAQQQQQGPSIERSAERGDPRELHVALAAAVSNVFQCLWGTALAPANVALLLVREKTTTAQRAPFLVESGGEWFCLRWSVL